MPKRTEKPFNKITTARTRLAMYVEYGEATLQGQTHAEFIADVAEAFGYLMDFRNIINGMVSLDEDPQTAALFYLDTTKIVSAAKEIEKA